MTSFRIVLLGMLVVLVAGEGPVRAQKPAKGDIKGRPWVVVKAYLASEKEEEIADFDSKADAEAYAKELWDQVHTIVNFIYAVNARRRPDQPLGGPRAEFDSAIGSIIGGRTLAEKNAKVLADFNKAVSDDPKKKAEMAKTAKESADRIQGYKDAAWKKLEDKMAILERGLNQDAERANASNKAAKFRYQVLDEIRAGEGAKKEEIVKKIDAGQKGLADLLGGLTPNERKTVLDQLDKAMPGFKADVERKSEEMYRKYFDLDGKLKKDAWQKDAEGYQTYKVQALKMYGEHKITRELIETQVAKANDAIDKLTVAVKVMKGTGSPIGRYSYTPPGSSRPQDLFWLFGDGKAESGTAMPGTWQMENDGSIRVTFKVNTVAAKYTEEYTVKIIGFDNAKVWWYANGRLIDTNLYPAGMLVMKADAVRAK